MGRSRKKQSDGLKQSDRQKQPGNSDRPLGYRSRTSRSRPPSVSDNELRRYILLLSVPLIALILIIVILISGNFRDRGTETTDEVAARSAGTLPENAPIPVIEPDTKEYFHDFGGSILAQDAIPEVNWLMEQYFFSISECDMETFLNLFTSQDTSEEERYRREFEKQKQYTEGYQNISCYTVPGPEENSYAAYVYYEIKYTGAKTAAPSLVQVYTVQGEDGVYRIFDGQMTPELEDYLEQLDGNEDVRLLVSQVDRQMEEAMASDQALNERILYMKQGPDYMHEDGQ